MSKKDVLIFASRKFFEKIWVHPHIAHGKSLQLELYVFYMYSIWLWLTGIDPCSSIYTHIIIRIYVYMYCISRVVGIPLSATDSH